MFISRKRRSESRGGGGTAPYWGDSVFSQVTVPRNAPAPYQETFTAGRTSTNPLNTNIPTKNMTNGQLDALGEPWTKCQFSSGRLLIGNRSGTLYDNLTFTDYDFRGIDYDLQVQGANITFDQCLFDASGFGDSAQNFNWISCASNSRSYVNITNCFFNGLKKMNYIAAVINGYIGEITYNKFIDFPCDWGLVTAPYGTSIGTPVEVHHNIICAPSTGADYALELTGSASGGAIPSITTPFSVAIGNYIRVTARAGTSPSGTLVGTVDITSTTGTLTPQDIIDALNAYTVNDGTGLFVQLFYASFAAGQIKIYCQPNGTVPYIAVYVNPNSIRVSEGTASNAEVDQFFGSTARTNGQTSANTQKRYTTANAGLYNGAHADIFQSTSSLSGSGAVSIHHNLMDMTINDNAAHGAGTAPLNLTASLGDHYADFDVYDNDMILSRPGSGKDKTCTRTTSNITRASQTNTSPSTTYAYGKQAIYRNYLQIGVSSQYDYPQLAFFYPGAAKSGWSNPATLIDPCADGSTITFNDNFNTVVVTASGGAGISGQQIIDAINNSTTFRYSASLQGSNPTKYLRISGYNPERTNPQDRPYGRQLIISTSGATLSTFGLTASTHGGSTANGGTGIQGTAWYGNFDFESPLTQANGVGPFNTGNFNVPPSGAPANLTVTGVTDTTITVQFDKVTNAVAYQGATDGGTSYSIVSTDMSSTVSVTFTGLTPGTAYTIAVRGANCWTDAATPTLKQFGSASTVSTSTSGANRIMAAASDPLMAAAGDSLVWTTEAEALGLLLALD